MWGDYELPTATYIIEAGWQKLQLVFLTEQRFVKIIINTNQSEKQMQKLFEIEFGDDFKEDVVIKRLFDYAMSNLCGLTQDISSRARNLPGVVKTVKHPVTGDLSALYNIIMNLNDNHSWTREQIADWIETLDEVPAFGTPEEVEVTVDEKDLTILANEVRLPQSAFGKQQQHL